MFNDNTGRLWEFAGKSPGRVYIKDIVIGEISFPLQTRKFWLVLDIKTSLLMRVLAIA
jgi:hypothetical protein